MIRNLKALGLTALAVLSMSAVAASAAQGAVGTVTAEKYPAVLTGTQLGLATFSIGAGVRIVSCTAANLDATLSGPSANVTVTPTFGGCTAAPGGLATTVIKNGCDYTLGATQPGTTGHGATTGTFTAAVDCTAGSAGITVHIYENAAKHAAGTALCTYVVPPQAAIPAGIYHLEGAGKTRDIKGTVEAKPTTINKIGPAILCGGAAGAHVASTLKGEYTIEAFEDTGSASEYKHNGVQVGLFVS